MERWKAERCVEMRHSLLHFGFEVGIPAYEFPNPRENGVYNQHFGDRIIFYLDAAEGHSLYEREKLYENYWLAQKAFMVLCHRLFPSGIKAEERRYGSVGTSLMPTWAETVVIDERIIQRILAFFRLREGSHCIKVANLDDSGSLTNDQPNDLKVHHLATAREFAYDFACFIREFQFFGEYAGEKDNKIREMLDKYMLDALTLMVGLGRLDCLRNATAISDISRAHLERLALSQKLWFDSLGTGESRTPATLEEAAYAGSQLASALLLVKIKQQERKRFEMIAKLRAQARVAERQLAEIEQAGK